jgi:hypothetical protein
VGNLWTWVSLLKKLKKDFLQGKTLQGKCSKLGSFLGSAVVFEPKQLFNVI